MSGIQVKSFPGSRLFQRYMQWGNALALMICLLVASCTAAPTAVTVIPATGGASGFQVHEYTLIEQSKDNPDNVNFAERVPAAVAAARGAWRLPGAQDALEQSNKVLETFGYHLAPNLSAPFSGYTLFYGEDQVQRNIAQFEPASVLADSSAHVNTDFLLAFVTLDGQRLIASTQGIRPLPQQGPVSLGGSLAFAVTGNSNLSGAYAAGSMGIPTDVQASANTQHQVAQINGHVLMDGRDLNLEKGADEVFDWRMINGQPFYFYTRAGITHLNYAGHDLPYTYDRVIHGNQSANAQYNPGTNGHIVWFYALRDGLWYYIEAGQFGK